MPAPDYATLQQLKDYLGITDTARDSVLTMCLAAASRWVDGYTGRRFYLDATATARTFNLRDRTLGGNLLVDDIGASAGLTVETGTTGGTFTAVTGYDTVPGNTAVTEQPITAIYNPSGWPEYSTQTVRVTARWGWPVVPAEVTQATLIQASRLFKRKDAVEGTLGQGEWGPIRMSRMDPDVSVLLAPFKFTKVA